MHLPSLGKYFYAIMLFSFSMVVVFSSAVKAERMTSTNYVIQADALGIGGNTSTSTNYQATDTIGELATGSDLQSTNYRACAGFECFQDAPYITFSVREGITAPGTIGAGVNLGTLSPSSVTTSNGTSVNSVFLTAASNAPGGVVASVRSLNAALERISVPADTIPSATATLVAGTQGYGICVSSVGQDGGSPTVLTKSSPYDGTCTTSTGHDVGIVDGTNRPLVTSSGQLLGGTSEILVKASISSTTDVGSDYSDTLTFILTGTY